MTLKERVKESLVKQPGQSTDELVISTGLQKTQVFGVLCANQRLDFRRSGKRGKGVKWFVREAADNWKPLKGSLKHALLELLRADQPQAIGELVKKVGQPFKDVYEELRNSEFELLDGLYWIRRPPRQNRLGEHAWHESTYKTASPRNPRRPSGIANVE